MSEREIDPRRLAVQAFARAGAELSGEWPQANFTRLVDGTLALADAALPPVRWSVRGELRPEPGSAPRTWLHLQADTAVRLQCQRCLMPMEHLLHVERSFLFAPDETEAARLDEESEDDVLVLQPSLDLTELVEDELILSLPIVPRHDHCPQPLCVPEASMSDEADAAAHPFAGLAALRQRPKSGP